MKKNFDFYDLKFKLKHFVSEQNSFTGTLILFFNLFFDFIY